MKIRKIKNIECEFRGLIPHQVVANYIFDDDEDSAIDFLESLVENGLLKFLNESNDNRYYRFIINTNCNCDICPKNGCVEPVIQSELDEMYSPDN